MPRVIVKDDTIFKHTAKTQFPVFKLNQTLFFVNPGLKRNISKAFFAKAREIYSQKYLHYEINFLIDMFVENGHDHNHIFAIINEKGNSKNQTNDDSNIKEYYQTTVDTSHWTKINSFYATGLFLYPLKASENEKFSDVFKGYRKRPVT